MPRKSQGIIVRDLVDEAKERGEVHVGARYLFRVWAPIDRKYVSARFDSLNAGNLWAKERQPALGVGIEQAGRVSVDDVLKSYDAELTRRGNAPKHVAEAKWCVEQCRDAGLRDMLDDNARAIVKRWSAAVKARDGETTLAPATINRYLRHLKAFFAYAVEEQLIRHNVVEGIRSVNEPDEIEEPYLVSELRTMLAPANRGRAFFWRAAVMAYTGLRLEEAVHLRMQEVDFENNRIRVRRPLPTGEPRYRLKGNKERWTCLAPEFRALLKSRDQVAGYLFADEIRNAAHVTHSRNLARFLKDVEIPQRAGSCLRGCHTFRHTWTTLMLASGVNEILVQSYAGHAHLSTTQGYAKTQDRFADLVRREKWDDGDLRLQPIPEAKPAPQAKTGTD